MILIAEEILIIENSKKYLTAFLENFGEFFPFAMIMDSANVMFPLEHNISEDDYTDSVVLIDLYEHTLSNEICVEKSQYKLGVICIDIYINSTIDEVITKRNAIEFRIIGSNYRKKVVQFYEINQKNKIVFKELVGYD